MKIFAYVLYRVQSCDHSNVTEYYPEKGECWGSFERAAKFRSWDDAHAVRVMLTAWDVFFVPGFFPDILIASRRVYIKEIERPFVL